MKMFREKKQIKQRKKEEKKRKLEKSASAFKDIKCHTSKIKRRRIWLAIIIFNYICTDIIEIKHIFISQLEKHTQYLSAMHRYIWLLT